MGGDSPTGAWDGVPPRLLFPPITKYMFLLPPRFLHPLMLQPPRLSRVVEYSSLIFANSLFWILPPCLLIGHYCLWRHRPWPHHDMRSKVKNFKFSKKNFLKKIFEGQKKNFDPFFPIWDSNQIFANSPFWILPPCLTIGRYNKWKRRRGKYFPYTLL